MIYHVFGIEGLLLSTIATGMAAAFFSFKLKKEQSKVIGQKEILNTTAEQIKTDKAIIKIWKIAIHLSNSFPQ